ncbi:MAG: replication initiation protein [Spirochaetaceae bacterium]|jgi:hypothetical protein|nr:replication initiation protein [Spirochaetaceae bacterium]
MVYYKAFSDWGQYGALRLARRKPLKLAADVDKGLTRLLDADPGYGKLISKNPLSEKDNKEGGFL